VAANRNAYELIARSQGWEWKIVRNAALQMPLTSHTRVYMIRPEIGDRATRRTFADEFGTLSSDTDWCAYEMLKSALRRRFPAGLPAGLGYTFRSGTDAPRPGTFDLVIDMRTLEKYRLD
jgi:hypothetical protein